MEFLVEFEVDRSRRDAETEVEHRERAEASAAAKLVDEGHLAPGLEAARASGETEVLGLYRADSETQLDGLLGALPLYELDARHGHPARAASERPGWPRDRAQP